MSEERQLIGEILLERKVINQEQLDDALAKQKESKKFLGEILVELGFLEETDIVVALVVQCGLPYIAINKYDIDPEIVRIIPYEVAKENQLIALDRIGDVLSLVMTNPCNKELKLKLQEMTGCRVATFIATKTEIDQAIEHWYK